jgi:dipeptidyl-peptidase-3
MDQATIKQYLADDPPTIVPLAIKPHFDALQPKEKKYAHYISRAALAGTRINLRQVSAESEAIYDFIIELHRCENGEWRWKPIQTGNKYTTKYGRLTHCKATGPKSNPKPTSQTPTSSTS